MFRDLLVYTYRQMIECCLQAARLHRPIVSLPWSVAYLQGAIMERLPTTQLFTITRDQVHLLRINNKVADTALGLMDLGIEPTSLESVLPTYLAPKKATTTATMITRSVV